MLPEKLTRALNASINLPLLTEEQEFRMLLPVVTEILSHLPDQVRDTLQAADGFVSDVLLAEWTGKLIGFAKVVLLKYFPRLKAFPQFTEGLAHKLGVGIMHYAQAGKAV